ncbi:RagB/SusD family nutrient uptake outer membrane protein [Chitinophaga silvatica]|uniref:RagB/SusD family nutrient uptake outer membrane protein n=1 Tax=Chitinophaga silvatica TaxID=2282649 RepID=A0A3E1Y5I0_9BACT|nr:RagB/SusD family nutrient uptake outer membrane protein [Chitinophaga silvatica]RFS20000.1 RagB/SusD family nutrient uptake outer membrane protein [Chitinophaga silvatica]
MQRYIKSLSLLVAAITLGSCGKDFLERQPQGRFTTETYPGGQFEQYIYGMYATLRDYGVHVMPFIAISSIRSDDADKGSTPADGADQKAMDEFTLAPSNGLVKAYYTALYSGVNKCNQVLKQVSIASGNVSEEDKRLSIAEAKMLRGYFYFNLVRAFGGVPKIDSLITDEARFNVPRASKEAIYALIEEDLTYAAANLPLKWDPKYIGRVTKGAAQGLLAKVYLYEKKYAQAIGMTTAVINSGQYNLQSSYSYLYSEEGENCSESIFEVQALYTISYTGYGCQYAQVQGVRGAGTFDLGWGFNVPSATLVAAYEAGDPRRDATILYAGETTPYGETLPTNLPNPRYNQKVYTNPKVRLQTNSRFGQWMNIRLLHYSDVLLMHAEAANEQGQTDEALAKLEMVRARARGKSDILPAITERDKNKLTDLIRQERRIELAMEHERFYDIVRWGIAKKALQADGKNNFVEGKHELLPIPQDEIDKAQGILIQNPNY